MEPIEGVDYSSDRPSIVGLANVGKRFACRYVGPGTADKHLTPIESQELSAHGLSIVSNAEGMCDGLLGGYGVGADWAGRAHDHAVACGMPPNRPIYLSVDFDVQADQWPAVADALDGAAAVLGLARVGIYGGYNAVDWAIRDGKARWCWQTYAWSQGRWHPMNRIRQYRNGVSLVGGTVDLDQAMVSDYGQWTTIQGGTDDMTPQETALLYNASSIAGALGAGKNTTLILATWEDPAHGGHVGVLGADPPDEYEISLAPFWERVGRDQAEMVELGELRARLDELVNAPLVDAVAVAAAIAAHPDIAARLAADVAARLAVIDGAITLTGSLSGGIHPPAQ